MKKNYDKNMKCNGFTLIEFVLYFAITTIVLTLIVQISMNVFIGKEKIEAHQEVGRNGRSAINEIIQIVSESEEVVGTSDGTE
jgi:type II secretory pathway pseudopilin PulG